MTVYIIKSSVSLLLMFGLYWFLLRKEKLFVFNRFFLIVSLAFSLVLPFVTIPVNFQIAPQLNEIIPSYNYVAPAVVVADNNVPTDLNVSQPYLDKETALINIFTILLVLYISGVLLFLIRFLRSIYFILRRSKLSEKISYEGYRIVLTDDKTGPYCFFSNIFLNKDDYLNGKIDKELLNHELEHVRQSHTVDIILIELVKIFYWFNPIHLLYDRAIRINHEYLADNGVINENSDIKSYTDKLLNFISCSSNMSLTSGSNNSFTKLRLMMMMKSRSGSLRYGARIAVTLCMGTVFFLLLSFKESKSATSLSKEGIATQQNVVKGIGLGAEKKPQNFQLENASEATIVNNIYNFSGNVIIRILKTDTNCTLIKSDSATYDKEKNIITVSKGTMEKYNSGDVYPFEKSFFVHLKYDAESGKVIAKEINAVVYFKDNMIDFSGKWVLNNSQSKSYLSEVATSTMVISQDKNSVTMNITFTTFLHGEPNNRTIKYVFNESIVKKNTEKDSTVITCTQADDGKSFSIIELNPYMYNSVERVSKRISVYTLSKDGKNLIIKSDDTLPEGSITPESERHEKRVYDRGI